MKRRTYTVAAIAVSMILIVSVALAFLKHRRDIGLFPDQTKNTSTFSTTFFSEMTHAHESTYSTTTGIYSSVGDRIAIIQKDKYRVNQILSVREKNRTVFTEYGMFFRCQLVEDGVFFQESNKLYYRSFSSNKKEQILTGVKSFMIADNTLITIENGEFVARNFSMEVLYTLPNATACCYNGESIYVLLRDGTIGTICIGSQSMESIGSFGFCHSYPFDFCCSSNRLVLCQYSGAFVFDIETSELQSFNLWKTASGEAYAACNENSAVVAYQEMAYSGSFASEIESPENGMWLIDLTTWEITKLPVPVMREFDVVDQLIIGYDKIGRITVKDLDIAR